MRSTLHGAGWIADYDRSFGHILRYHSAHADNCTSPNAQRTVGCTLLQNCTGTNISMIFNMDIAIAFHAWRKGNIVAYYTVMRNI